MNSETCRRILYCLPTCILIFVAASCRSYQIGQNPASMLKNEHQARGIVLTETDVDSLKGLLYYLDFENDYQLDKVIDADVRSIRRFVSYTATHFLNTGKVLANFKKLKPACTAFVCATPGGDVLYARNFDYTADGPSPVVLARTVPENGYKSVSMISLSLLDYRKGYLSDGKTDVSLLAVAPYLLMDGMNEKGLAISVLYLDPEDSSKNIWYGGTEQYDRQKHDIMTVIAMRMVLDRCSSVQEAIALLDNYNMFANGKNPKYSYHFLIGDREGNGIVLEYVPIDGKWKMSPVQTNLVTNYYLSPYLRYVGHGHDRYDEALQMLKKSQMVLSEEEAMRVLQAVSQAPAADKTSNTQWSVIYNLTKRTYLLCVGRKYDMFIRGNLEK